MKTALKPVILLTSDEDEDFDPPVPYADSVSSLEVYSQANKLHNSIYRVYRQNTFNYNE